LKSEYSDYIIRIVMFDNQDAFSKRTINKKVLPAHCATYGLFVPRFFCRPGTLGGGVNNF